MTNNDEEKGKLMNTALTITALVTEAGYGLLPTQPTTGMLVAGVETSGLTMAQVRQIYCAMHREALHELGEAAHDPLLLLQKLSTQRGH